MVVNYRCEAEVQIARYNQRCKVLDVYRADLLAMRAVSIALRS